MTTRWKTTAIVFGVLLAIMHFLGDECPARQGASRSHAPLRELPPIANRPMSEGPAYFVDAKAGRDSNPGSEDRPWGTINHALKQRQAGDTLYIRAGTYFENVYCAVAGTTEKLGVLRPVLLERALSGDPGACRESLSGAVQSAAHDAASVE